MPVLVKSTDAPQLTPMEEKLLGAGLPLAAGMHLKQAGLCYSQDEIAERHLREAEHLAPGHPAVLIGLYRFFFYKGKLREALAVARECLARAAKENNLSEDWRLVNAYDAEFGSYDHMLPRFYLFTLKAYAYLQMRLGDMREGREAAQKLVELDPKDRIGAKVLLGVADRAEAGEED